MGVLKNIKYLNKLLNKDDDYYLKLPMMFDWIFKGKLNSGGRIANDIKTNYKDLRQS